MGLTHDGRDAWMFETDDGTVYCFDDADIVLYDEDDEKAWISCQDAPHLTDYR